MSCLYSCREEDPKCIGCTKYIEEGTCTDEEFLYYITHDDYCPHKETSVSSEDNDYDNLRNKIVTDKNYLND